PDHSTLSRRAETLVVARPPSSAEPVHLLVDSTGLKLSGAGEWLVEKHGTSRRRSWRKLHIGVDADTGRIVAAALTTNDVDDGSQVGPLLDQIDGPIASFTGDGAYDQDGVYRGRCPSSRSRGHRATALECGAERDRRDGAHSARPAFASDCRTWPHGLAENRRVQLACLGGSRYRPLETGHRSCAALANRQASSNRSGTRCQRPQPHAGAGTPELRPHRMRPRGPGIRASTG